jgi:hypothetical protein
MPEHFTVTHEPSQASEQGKYVLLRRPSRQSSAALKAPAAQLTRLVNPSQLLHDTL